MKLITALFMGLCCAASGLVAAKPVVEVKMGSTEFKFEQQPRLTEVLAPVALQQAWYWPASQLYRLNASQLEQQRSEALALISALMLDADDEVQLLLKRLAGELSSWQLAEKIPLVIDYDLARAKQAFNPLFESGHYRLQLKVRPVEVPVWGAVAKNVNLPLRSATSVHDYFDAIPEHPTADTSRFYLIQPNGNVIEILRGAWQQDRVEVMPGSTLYIPFSHGYFSKDFAELNKKLLALAVNRMD
ncbi:capsule biosynthesis GfcC family protein [Alishewanella sp. HL-SH06]|uniref:capsule biosynthesis GfcC family protein n=1 Tax=Alishewanella sp. HL-SH06 TaxID=3461144 RepID=UPI0040436369